MRIFGKLTNRYCAYFFTSFICKISFQDNSSYGNGVSCVIYKRHISVGYSTSMRRTSVEIPGFKSAPQGTPTCLQTGAAFACSPQGTKYLTVRFLRLRFVPYLNSWGFLPITKLYANHLNRSQIDLIPNDSEGSWGGIHATKTYHSKTINLLFNLTSTVA